MNLILDYIEANLDGNIDDEKIAVLSGLSKGMFQRIFAAVTEMTLSEYIRKRRLTQAASDIQNTDAKVIDIAVKYGYESATAFGSAFKRFHGITPSDAKTSNDISFQSFQRLTFMLTLSVKGGSGMQYRIIENAEDILQKMARKESIGVRKYLEGISEHNGVRCATDGYRAAVILPEGVDDWDLRDAYFESDSEDKQKFELGKIFNTRTDSLFNLDIQKKQAGDLVTLLEHLDDLKDDFKLISKDAAKQAVYLDIDTMKFIKSAEAKEAVTNSEKRIIGLNAGFLKEALYFVMCSDDERIEIYYNGDERPFIMKSARFYVAVLPVRIRGNDTVQ